MKYLLTTIGLYLLAVIILSAEYGLHATADYAGCIMVAVALPIAAVKYIKELK